MKPGFDPRPIHVRLVVNKVVLRQVFALSTLAFPCQYFFHQCSILTFIMLFLSEEKMGKAWEPSKSNAKITNIRDSHRGIKDFKRAYQPRTNIVKDEKSY
jgi:hypothetical protein